MAEPVEPLVSSRMMARLRKAAAVGVVARPQEPVALPQFDCDHDDVDVPGGAAVSSATSSCSHSGGAVITSSSSTRLDSSLPQLPQYKAYAHGYGARKLSRCSDSSSQTMSSSIGRIGIPHRKRSGTTIDLSVSLSENNGLGIYNSLGGRDRGNDDGSTTGSLSGARHYRSTSGASQLSFGSLPRPGGQYVHPMRQTPRPYTPPLGQSNQISATASTDSHLDGIQRVTDFDDPVPTSQELFPGSPSPSIYNEPRTSVQIESETTTYPPTKTRTTSLGRVFNSNSNNSPSPRDTAPLSRNSLEFGLRSKSRRPSTVDPAARAIAVQAARQAFEDREAAKNRKRDEQVSKALDKEQRRLRRLERENSYNSYTGGRQSISDFTLRRPSKLSEKDSRRKNSASSFADDTTTITWKPKSPKSAWVMFLTWLRTKIFKIGKKLKKVG
ncbi:hypothetical protein MGYG_05862 [Nannizzia gypsea CBS 118893]|uniref:Uncharacterized protein n=1 Tax=Arthroderma gypseum (strain ATCC MYA-4604 / CBS 118893) TaxID=535722 RepID=E4UZS4_ARTGP|nr:hypothetical protein MGYG_05862 [Nannizzia gypsea CBS 118893]EFR02861.1 hypothetical protein MGYG_05862 [Nannizzia gypsea CBS 118893]